MYKIFGPCLYNLLLISSDPGDFLALNAFMVVSNSSIVIKSTQFSVNFAHFLSVVLSLDCLVQSFDSSLLAKSASSKLRSITKARPDNK